MSELVENSSRIAARRRWLQGALGSLALVAGCVPRTGQTTASRDQSSRETSTENLITSPVFTTDDSGLKTPSRTGAETYETSLGKAWVESHVRWPSIQLLNQRSKSLDLYHDLIAQQRVIINFFYTRCTGNCPVTMGRMIKLARNLSVDQRRNTKFISISLDATRERPEDLASYADSVLPEDVDWQLLCGPQETVDQLRRYLGFYELNEATDAIPRSHASMVLFGNDLSHRWIALPAVSTFRQWRSVLARVSA